MATVVANRAGALMTAEELLQLPDDGSCRHELVKGVLIETSPPKYRHGRLAADLAYHLRTAAEAAGGQVAVEAGFVLSRNPDTVRGPDVAFVGQARLRAAGEMEGYFPGAPDIAAEILSPSNTADEMEQKVQEYLAASGRLVWVLDGGMRRVRVRRADGSTTLLGEDDTLTGEDVLPGFGLALRDLFR